MNEQSKTMAITEQVAIEVASHEAIVREAYKDSVGVWTWSVGLTSMSGHSVERYIDNPQSIERCVEVYLWALERYADDVRKVFKDHPLTEAQFAAALSFHWNTGAIKSASWVRKWKAGDIAGARVAFMAWRKPKEIIPRRQAERDLFFHGRWSNKGTVTEWPVRKPSHRPDWRNPRTVDLAAVMARVMHQNRPARPQDVADVIDIAGAPRSSLARAIAAFFRVLKLG